MIARQRAFWQTFWLTYCALGMLGCFTLALIRMHQGEMGLATLHISCLLINALCFGVWAYIKGAAR